MATEKRRDGMPDTTVLAWLLDADSSIRWQVMRDLTGESPEAVTAERARVATVGWGARLLDLQGSDGNWGGRVWLYRNWTSTFETLVLLKDFGVDPTDERVRRAITLVRDNVTWGEEFSDAPFFEGEVEPCINGRTLAVGAYFGEASERLVERLLGEQLQDGGWNCDAPPSTKSSFHTTICVLEGLLEYEQSKTAAGEVGGLSAVREARLRGHEYLLERGLFRSLSTGAVIAPEWTQFSFPPRYYYDVLRGLDYLRKAGVKPDGRMAEAIDLVHGKRADDGSWSLERPIPGDVHFDMEGEAGTPSRWNTLRALRVLDWYSGR